MSKITSYSLRRAVYFVIAAILTILVAVGLITEDQYSSWVEIVDKAWPIIGSIALFVAGSKTHRGSDDPTTHEDVERAYNTVAPVQPAMPAPTSHPIADVFEQVKPAIDSAVEQAKNAYHEATFRK